MPTLLHTADIHIEDSKRESTYSLTVFTEIMQLAADRQVDAVLIAGDLFDNHRAASEFREEVRNITAQFSGPILYLPGNHEELNCPDSNEPLKGLDLSPIKVLNGSPYELFTLDFPSGSVEILAIKHYQHYPPPVHYQIPKKKHFRIAMAHGIVAGMAYTGPDEEGNSGILDPELFMQNEVDYAALGHIHAARQEIKGSTNFVYPGSARVWRTGESGPRAVCIFDTDSGTIEKAPLKSAGIFHKVSINPDLNPQPEEISNELESQIRELKREDDLKNDYILIEFEGLIEDETVISEAERKITSQLKNRLRKVEFKRKLKIVSGISESPLAKNFLESLEEKKQQLRPELYQKVRKVGLEEIAEKIQ